MSKKNRYDIDLMLATRAKTKTSMDPADYVNAKVPIYAANVNLRRQIPEIRDGLIPVQRRILLSLYESKLFKGNIAKCAFIVGNTMRDYHPHGDASLYKSMVLMGQPFRNNACFIEKHGNFGTAANADGYGHYRYTECCMSDFAYDCYFSEWHLTNPEKDLVVDWVSNFEDNKLEPMYFPSKYPVFLLNFRRQMGIGTYNGLVGFSIEDAFKATIKLIEDPDAKFIIYPDDPEGCDLINSYDFANVLDGTDVKAKFRAKYNIAHYGGSDVIEITGTPFEVDPTTIIGSIKTLVDKGKLLEISDIGISSENFGDSFILSIKVRKGYDPVSVMNNLYKMTQLENTYSMTYQFVSGLESVSYTLRTAILDWIRLRRETLKRIHKNRLIWIITRILFLEPLIKVIESGDIEKFIEIIRKNNEDDAVEKIMKQWSLYDYQAKKIIDVKISDLSKDKLPKYKKELKELAEERKELEEIVNSHKQLNKIIIRDLEEGIKKYGVKRKSRVTQAVGKELRAADTDHYLVFTERYVKKLPFEDKGYRVGKTEGRIVKVMKVNNRETIHIFTRDGRCTPVKVDDIPNSNLQSIGVTYTQVKCQDNGFIDCLNASVKGNDIYNFVAVSEKGFMVKLSYDSMLEKEKSFMFMKLGKGDQLSAVALCTDNDSAFVFTKNGRGAIFPMDEVAILSGFNNKGCIASKPEEEDIIIGLTMIHPKDKEFVAIADDGNAKRVEYSVLPKMKRNGAMREIYTGGGNLAALISINDDTTGLVIYTTAGMWMIDPENITATSRFGKAQKIALLEAKDYVLSIEKTK